MDVIIMFSAAGAVFGIVGVLLSAIGVFDGENTKMSQKDGQIDNVDKDNKAE